MAKFKGASIYDDIKSKYGFEGELLDYFANHQGSVVDKWHHYIPIYDRYFSSFRGKALKFLEIGVSGGGSLEMWRNYFGPDANIFGIDIDPRCANHDGQFAQVRIGSQDDEEFLASVVEEMGGVDIVLDDGSHVMRHIKKSFEFLFPTLSENGVYMIEDLHTAYWSKYGGGYNSDKNFFNYVRRMIDTMHKQYHKRETAQDNLFRLASGLHIHDSIVVVDKYPVHPAVKSRVRGPR